MLAASDNPYFARICCLSSACAAWSMRYVCAASASKRSCCRNTAQSLASRYRRFLTFGGFVDFLIAHISVRFNQACQRRLLFADRFLCRGDVRSRRALATLLLDNLTAVILKIAG